MIQNYYRPTALEEALTYLKRPDTLPLGGGTLLSKPENAPVSVVDLQSLGLDHIHKAGNTLEIGATVTLQQLLEQPDSPIALKTALKLEAPLNIRNVATLAGTLVAADGRSPVATLLMALDAKLTHATLLQSNVETQTTNIGDFLPLRPPGLITKIEMPLNCKLAFESVARTPADKPIVSAALAVWPSGRMRLALGGHGASPLLAMDGLQAEGVEGAQAAARNAYQEAQDAYASAEYRRDVAATLARRCFDSM